ncbi:MAG TPA: tyrosine-type recombinase/integrase [Gemmataceae bacterium]|nr:tyrosine-type recombinase/integrase [Gemmataceae bacterium]
MPRPSKPWFREHDGWWYATIIPGQKPDKLVKGRENKDDAEKAFHRLKSTRTAGVEMDRGQCADVLERFLDHAQANYAPSTYEKYRTHLNWFSAHCGRVHVSKLIPNHLTTFLNTKRGWSQNMRASFIASVKASFGWARGEGLITQNPFADYKKPPYQPRRTAIEPDDLDRMIDVAGRHFRQLLVAMKHTGCRPGEVAAVEAFMVDVAEGTWEFDKHKTARKTGKRKVVYLTSEAMTLTKGLMAEHPEGPLFRTIHGNPWDRWSIARQFRILREKLGIDHKVVPYSVRHEYVTEALANGVPIASVAELVGHADTSMISRHYSKLDQCREHLREMARKAVGEQGKAGEE